MVNIYTQFNTSASVCLPIRGDFIEKRAILIFEERTEIFTFENLINQILHCKNSHEGIKNKHFEKGELQAKTSYQFLQPHYAKHEFCLL